MSNAYAEYDAEPTAHPFPRAAVDVLLVWLVFAFVGGWPIPDVNEAHYLTKAKHFWEPEWCAADPFLTSADSHVAFFGTFGYLTHVLPLPKAALVGRVLQWALLAWGWRRLSYSVAPLLGWAAISAAAMVALVDRANLAGEWIVGGCEAKVVAFALLFSALADVIAGRWNWAFAQLGGATLFHPLVGGWSLIALGFVWWTPNRNHPSLKKLLPGLIIAALLAFGGLRPAWNLTRGVDAPTRAEANQIYVQERLSHHLSPQQFSLLNYLRHALLWGMWLGYVLKWGGDARLRLLHRFTFAAGALALIGLGIGFLLSDGTRKDALLRFYWFRLSDVMPAIGLTLEIAAAAATAWSFELRRRAYWLLGLLVLIGETNLLGIGIVRIESAIGRGENLAYDTNLPTWQEACEWIKTNTPPDAVFITPKQFYTFKWYAERADTGVWKDIPQDAASIVAWRRRFDELYDGESWINFVPPAQIESFAKKYGASYVVAYHDPPLAFPVLYQNNDFVVYELPASNEAR